MVSFCFRGISHHRHLQLGHEHFLPVCDDLATPGAFVHRFRAPLASQVSAWNEDYGEKLIHANLTDLFFLQTFQLLFCTEICSGEGGKGKRGGGKKGDFFMRSLHQGGGKNYLF